jgi:imidazole glycerol-phosphate synthase subunit HisH
MRIMLFDYGAGNLHSLAKALRGNGRDVKFETDPRAAVDADVLVLPGVGAFEPAAFALASGRDTMRDAITSGLPCLGICLGMQLLFDASEEGAGAGLGVFAGSVTKLRTARTPHIGWNAVDDASDLMFADAGLDTAYYANSFACRPCDESVVTAWSTHDGDRFPAAVRAGNTVGVQFHPEKSSAQGVAFINEFLTRLPNS